MFASDGPITLYGISQCRLGARGSPNLQILLFPIAAKSECFETLLSGRKDDDEFHNAIASKTDPKEIAASDRQSRCFYQFHDSESRMTEAEAIDIAASHAQEHGWPWDEPIECRRYSRWFGNAVYRIRTNADKRGRNVVIEIDAAEGTIKRATFLPR